MRSFSWEHDMQSWCHDRSKQAFFVLMFVWSSLQYPPTRMNQAPQNRDALLHICRYLDLTHLEWDLHPHLVHTLSSLHVILTSGKLVEGFVQSNFDDSNSMKRWFKQRNSKRKILRILHFWVCKEQQRYRIFKDKLTIFGPLVFHLQWSLKRNDTLQVQRVPPNATHADLDKPVAWF